MNNLIKKCIASLVLSLLFTTAQSCQLQQSTSENIKNVVKNHGGYEISDFQCKLLADNNLALLVYGHGAVLNGVNVGWAIVALQDLKFNIISNKMGRSTQVNTGIASQNVADDILYDAITAAIKALDWKVAVNEVNQYRALKTKK